MFKSIWYAVFSFFSLSLKSIAKFSFFFQMDYFAKAHGSSPNLVERVALNTSSPANSNLQTIPSVMEIDPDLIAELKYERTAEKLQNLDAKKTPTGASGKGSGNSFKECKPIFIPHPNGKYCCV